MSNRLTRRDFIKVTGSCVGAVALLPIVQACAEKGSIAITTSSPTPPPPSKPTPVPTSSPAPAATQAKDGNLAMIALVRTHDRQAGVKKAIDLLGTNAVKDKQIMLKPNFNTSDPAPGSTHNDTLRSLVLKLRGMGATKITLAERSGPPDTRQVMEQKGISSLAEELDFGVINLQESGEDGWVLVRPPESHWRDGFLFAKPYQDAECIVVTCCLKTHAYGGHFTMSLKNAVGMVPRTGYGYMRELHSSPYQRLMIAEINTAFKPDLIVMDGVVAFVNGGPDRGQRVKAGVMLAGSDRVAMDAVGVAILRFFGATPEVSRGPIFQQEQIARAVELGLGVDSAQKISLVTGDKESKAFAEKIQTILSQG